MALAIFDLDNTLICGDSDYAWGQFLVAKGIVDAASYKEANDQFYHQYTEGALDIDAYLRFCLAPLSRYSLGQLNDWHREFMRQCIYPMLLPKAKSRLAYHRNQGDYLLIITATNRFVAEPIAGLLGVDHLLATDIELIDGHYTGKPKGQPCFQEGKIDNLQRWLRDNSHDMVGSYFYSDSINDLPLLKIVDHPIVVDGDEKLLDYAKQAGWTSLSFR